MSNRDMTPEERKAACDAFTRWIELKAQMQAEWQAVVARRVTR